MGWHVICKFSNGGAAAAPYDNPFLRIKHEFVESSFMYMSDRSKGCMHAWCHMTTNNPKR
jgi:hypothetical protein